MLRGRANLKLVLINNTKQELFVSLTLNHKIDVKSEELQMDLNQKHMKPGQTLNYSFYKDKRLDKSNITSILGIIHY